MKQAYLGDGLYVEFDGWQLCLKANSSTEPTDRVYLDEDVYNNLVKFVDGLKEEQ